MEAFYKYTFMCTSRHQVHFKQ